MKIAAIEVYQADLPLVDGSYAWADGKVVSEYDSTVGGDSGQGITSVD